MPTTAIDRGMLVLADETDQAWRWIIGAAARVAGPPPPLADLRAFVSNAADRAPGLTYRLAGTGSRSRWEPDPHFASDQHVAYHQVPAGTNAYDACLHAMRQPLAHGRPLWDCLVVHGYDETEHMLCYRAHHAYQDGMGVALALEAALTGKQVPPPAPMAPLGLSAAIPGMIGSLPALRPRRAGRPWRDRAPSGRGGACLRTARLDPDAIEALRSATGATSAQVGLAVLAGALRARHQDYWRGRSAGKSMTVYMPISRHDPDHPVHVGNQVGLIPVGLPCAKAASRDRLQSVADQTDHRSLLRARTDQAFLDRVPHALMRAALPAISRCLRGHFGATMIKFLDPALPGARELFAVPPLPAGMTAMFGFLQTETTCTATCLFDDSVPGAHRFPDLLHSALAELATDLA